MILLLSCFSQFALFAQQSASTPEDTIEDVQNNVTDAFSEIIRLLSPGKIISILLIMLAVWLITKGMDWVFRRLAYNFNQYRLQILRLRPIFNVLLWALTAFVLVDTIIQPESKLIIAVLASSAFAVGFAAQDILKNFIGGLLIILERPFSIGDRIQVGSVYGEVKRIGLRATQVNTLDDSMVTIPNSKITSEMVSNANSGALDCMVVINLWLPINIEVEKTRKIAFEAAVTSRYVNIDRPIQILFFDHFDNQASTNVRVKAYVLDARYEKAFEGDVTGAAKKAFREARYYDLEA